MPLSPALKNIVKEIRNLKRGKSMSDVLSSDILNFKTGF
jgi:hypothetical protein